MIQYSFTLNYRPGLLENNQAFTFLSKTWLLQKQKALGRKVKGFKQKIWLKNREAIVYQAIKLKFTQNKHLMRELIATGTKELVEASPMIKYGE